MKFWILPVTALLISFSVSAQLDKDLPAFGEIDKTTLEMKECIFDKNAEAVVLFDVLMSSCDRNFNLSTERRIRIKILNDKGLDKANIHIRYRYENHVKPIRGLTAQTYNLDAAGNIVSTKVEKAQIFDKPINKRYSEIIFTFPQVKAGSVVEYKYSDESIVLGNWYFQKEIPVALSRFTIDYPSEIEFTVIPFCVLPLEKKHGEKSKSNAEIYTMKNIPALRDEPFISSDEDYLQRLETKLVAITIPGIPRRNLVHTWPQVIRSLMEDEDFGTQLNKNIPRTQDLDDMLKKITRPYDKMVLIHNYVRKNMEWNGYDNIWAMDGVKSAWKDKKGTSGEINLILVNLLKDAGLSAHPVLVSTCSNGRVNTMFADYHQFDKVMAYVTIGDNEYTLDATEKYTPSKLIPLDVAASEGLVIEKIETMEWGWRVLYNPAQEFKTAVYLWGEMDNNGQMTGQATVVSADYARIDRAEELKQGKDKFIEKYYTSRNTGVKVDSLVIENEDRDSLPLIQKFLFSAPASSSGDYRYFGVNLFSGLEKNPFIADNRFSDIFFGATQSTTILGTFRIPENYAFEDLPSSVRMITPDTSIAFTRMLQVDGDVLSVKFELALKKPVYNTDEYPDFKEFYKKLFGLLSEQFVIKKKK